MSDKFFEWLARKYGWSDETFVQLDQEFQDTLIREFASIAASY